MTPETREKMLYLIDKAIDLKDVSVSVDEHCITLRLKKWDGYKNYSAFHTHEVIGNGFTSIDKIIELVAAIQ